MNDPNDDPNLLPEDTIPPPPGGYDLEDDEEEEQNKHSNSIDEEEQEEEEQEEEDNKDEYDVRTKRIKPNEDLKFDAGLTQTSTRPARFHPFSSQASVSNILPSFLRSQPEQTRRPSSNSDPSPPPPPKSQDLSSLWTLTLPSVLTITNTDFEEALYPDDNGTKRWIPFEEDMSSLSQCQGYLGLLNDLTPHEKWINICSLLLHQIDTTGADCLKAFDMRLNHYDNPDLKAFIIYLKEQSSRRFQITRIPNKGWKSVPNSSKFALLRYDYAKLTLAKLLLVHFSSTLSRVSFNDQFTIDNGLNTSHESSRKSYVWLDEYRKNPKEVDFYSQEGTLSDERQLSDTQKQSKEEWIEGHNVRPFQKPDDRTVLPYLSTPWLELFRSNIHNIPDLQTKDYLYSPMREFCLRVTAGTSDCIYPIPYFKRLTEKEEGVWEKPKKPSWTVHKINQNLHTTNSHIPPAEFNLAGMLDDNSSDGFLMTRQTTKVQIKCGVKPSATQDPLLVTSLHCLRDKDMKRSPVLYQSEWKKPTDRPLTTNETLSLSFELQSIFTQNQGQAKFMLDNFYDNKGLLLYETLLKVRDPDHILQSINVKVALDGFSGPRLYLCLHLMAMEAYSHARTSYLRSMDSHLELLHKKVPGVREAMLTCCPKGNYKGIDLKL